VTQANGVRQACPESGRTRQAVRPDDDAHRARDAEALPRDLGDPVADAKLIEELSPIHAVDRVRAPLFVYQGKNDAHVPRIHC
jgi:dipeptidyl aminopeptidase/acylaminoacyl peptidase